MRNGMLHPALAAVLLLVARGPDALAAEAKAFNVRDYGARGDGRTLDTAAINRAVEACAAAGGGRVVLPPGRYLSGTVKLASDLDFVLDAGATLVGSLDARQPVRLWSADHSRAPVSGHFLLPDLFLRCSDRPLCWSRRFGAALYRQPPQMIERP